MKNKLISVFVCVCLVFTFAIPCISHAVTVSTEKDISVSVNDIILKFDQPPVIVNDRTLVPMRAIFEALGMNVEWNDAERKVTASGNGYTVELVVNSEFAYVNGKEVKLDTPATIISSRTMVPVRFVSEATGNNVYWDTKYEKRVVITSPLPSSVTASINSFESRLFDERLLDWSVNCYDPQSGGFYRSKTAKETVGFYADREASIKHIEVISQMVNVSQKELVSALTPEMKEKMTAFARESQSDEDGNWYELPWTKYANESKILYGNSGATQLLGLLGEKPLYKTAAERVAEQKAASTSSVMPKDAKTGNLNNTGANYTVTTLASSSTTDRFSSKENFKEWVDSLSWDTSLYTAGSLLCSNLGNIRAAGDDMFDYAIELIEEHIDPETGFLAAKDSETGEFVHKVNYDALSGSYKIATFYGESHYPSMMGRNYTYPYFDKLIESTAKVMCSDEPGFQACDVSNAWTLLRIARFSQKNVPADVEEKLYSLFPSMIDATVEKAMSLKLEDGGFSYYAGIGSDGYQGSTSALPIVEGQLTAAAMMFQLRKMMYQTLGIETPPVLGGRLSLDDAIDKLKKVENTTKTQFTTECEYTFNDMPTGPLSKDAGFRYSGDIQIVNDPRFIDEKALCITSPGGVRPVLVLDAGTKAGKGYTIEYDIKFDTKLDDTGLLMNEIGSWEYASVLTLRKTSGQFVLARTTDSNVRIAQGFNWNDYHNVKVVYNYNDGAPVTEFYFDGNLVSTSGHYIGGYPDKPAPENVSYVMFRADHTAPFSAYIDNLKFYEHK